MMMIEIQKETSTSNGIDQELLKIAVSSTLRSQKKSDVDITLRLTGDQEMRKLNQVFRGINRSTDVLAFNQGHVDPDTHRQYLGDVIISVDKASQQAPENNHSLTEECAFLAIHGTLHLLGYDHDKPDQKKEMWRLQQDIFIEVISGY
jgi:probable rRNA maturation factor